MKQRPYPGARTGAPLTGRESTDQPPQVSSRAGAASTVQFHGLNEAISKRPIRLPDPLTHLSVPQAGMRLPQRATPTPARDLALDVP